MKNLKSVLANEKKLTKKFLGARGNKKIPKSLKVSFR